MNMRTPTTLLPRLLPAIWPLCCAFEGRANADGAGRYAPACRADSHQVIQTSAADSARQGSEEQEPGCHSLLTGSFAARSAARRGRGEEQDGGADERAEGERGGEWSNEAHPACYVIGVVLT